MTALLFLVVVLLGTVISTTTAKVHDISWRVPPPGTLPYENREVNVGDTMIFEWTTATLNVYYHPSGNCDNHENEVLIGLDANTQYVFQPEDENKEMFFVSDVQDNCQRGLSVTIKVNPAIAGSDSGNTGNTGGSGDDSGGNSTTTTTTRMTYLSFVLFVSGLLFLL